MSEVPPYLAHDVSHVVYLPTCQAHELAVQVALTGARAEKGTSLMRKRNPPRTLPKAYA